jgi:hypothetical protein
MLWIIVVPSAAFFGILAGYLIVGIYNVKKDPPRIV